MSPLEIASLQLLCTVVVGAGVYAVLRRRRRGFSSVEEQATLRALAGATSTLSSLRQGLSEKSAGQVLRQLRGTSGAAAVALYDTGRMLGYHGDLADGVTHRSHANSADQSIVAAMEGGRRQILSAHPDGSGNGCPVKQLVVSPLLVNERPVGALVTYHDETPDVASLRIASDLADLIATQQRLVQADQQTAALARAELRALRAQISPHFVYNTLTTIAAFVRTDPDRARELLTEFADFTRKAFRGPQSDYTTLADELVYVHQYLLFEQARFGDRLSVNLKVEPEVLGVVLPTLILQPLVENAVKHGIEASTRKGRITIEAQDQDDECLILVGDNGAGFVVDGILERPGGAISNIHQRLRQTFGPARGLVIESRLGVGTKVCLRVPKYKPGVRVS